MAKCVRLYYNNIHRDLELVKSNEGYWFFREYKMNPYIHKYQYTKWAYLGELKDIAHSKHTYENTNGNELTERILHFIFEDKDIIIKYDSNHNSKSVNNYRLPDIEKFKL